MKNRQILSLLFAAGAGAAFVAPPAAHAEGPSHFAPDEAGVVYHPGEAGPARSQAQVSAELATAQKTPDGASMLRWGSMSTPKVGAPRTRAEVVAELEAAQKQPHWDAAARLGAPLPAPRGEASKARARTQP